MKEHRRTSANLLLLIMIFFFSFLALTCAPYKCSLLSKISEVHFDEALMLPVFSIFERGFNDASTLLNQTTRMDLYNFIKANPGLHFRALSNSLSLPIGVLQYHLGLLVNGGLLSTHHDGRYKRYFESKRFTEAEMKVISILRNGTSGKILIALFEKPEMTHKDLALQLDISSQALSWQMRRLENMGFVKRNIAGLNVKYSLDETIHTKVSQCSVLLNSVAGRI